MHIRSRCLAAVVLLCFATISVVAQEQQAYRVGRQEGTVLSAEDATLLTQFLNRWLKP
ncbi:hypothetical protein [Gemmatimonas sp.]|jgi:uncharacterized membrane protein affecting hemolysin expression|uniref:hypothetical protein n=1 Tax=Gemmatimonas sp. TaxID=1962908 RepID=UPI0025BB4B05|nr:hypothetical protein [Gemmatimonas sp.]MCA2992965.1 hypothetical protein [Gemmatimonas sp.]